MNGTAVLFCLFLFLSFGILLAGPLWLLDTPISKEGVVTAIEYAAIDGDKKTIIRFEDGDKAIIPHTITIPTGYRYRVEYGCFKGLKIDVLD